MVPEAPVASACDMTMDEFIALVERNPERHYKFDARGDVIEVSPKVIHGVVQGAVVTLLRIWLTDCDDALPGYWAVTEVAHELEGWRCRPDVALVRDDSEPIPVRAPLLAVEIRSESNTRSDLQAKAARYLERGTQMVWLVYPESRTLELYRANEAMQTLGGEAIIDGGATLPGFRVAVSDIFPPRRQD